MSILPSPAVLTQQGAVSIIAGGWFLVALMLAAHKLAAGILHGVPSLTQSDVLPSLATALAWAPGVCGWRPRSCGARSAGAGGD